MYDFAINNTWLIPLLPLVGAVLAGFLGARWLKGQSHWPIWIGVACSAILSFSILLGMYGQMPKDDSHGADAATGEHGTVEAGGEHAESLVESHDWYTWIKSGDFTASAGALVDPLTAVMLCVVTGIGFFITVFAAGYMKGEEGYFRFFAYLGLFIFAMTILVLGNNLVMLYLGWEGVGLCSYLLIGYYYDKPAAREAAKKAFLVNRVGDFGFGLGIMLSFFAFGTVSYFGDLSLASDGLLEWAALPVLSEFQRQALNWIPFLLMIGAFGKSAQFPLYVWLPDAMEGPTPVSALIHAATMVTAGVYMIARCSTLFAGNEAALWTVAAIGAFTAIFAATIALRQVDLKKVFAYSTISQLGFMFVAVGVLAPVAGVFHLVTHAFFKALLFLSSGVVMHAMMGELDMRKMSGLKRELPRTRILMLIGCAALAGFPLLSGFWSKDEIIIAAGDRSLLLYLVLTVTAFMTAYYSFRLYFRVFEGPLVIPPPPEGGHGHGTLEPEDVQHAHASSVAVQTGTTSSSGVDEHLTANGNGHDAEEASIIAHHGAGHDHNHEPAIMMVPLYVLAIGALLAGFLNIPGHQLGHFLGFSPSFQLGYAVANDNKTFHGEVHEASFGLAHETLHGWALFIGALVAIAGIGTAWWFHLGNRAAAERLAERFRGVVRVLDGKYWVDEVYQKGIVEPLRILGKVFFFVDDWIIDSILKVISFTPLATGAILRTATQRGYLQGYALTMVLGIVIILLLVFL